MAQLLTIQPQGPNVDTRVTQPGQNVLQQAGKFATDIGETFAKIQDVQDVSEGKLLAADNQAKINQIHELNSQQITDPQEFRDKTNEQIRELHQSTMEAARTPRAQRVYAETISNDLINAQTKVQKTFYTKQIDEAKANVDAAEEIYKSSAVTATSPGNRAGAMHAFADLLGYTTARGLMKQDDATKRLETFNKKVNADTMNLAAQKNPDDFITRHEKGEFINNDPVDVQRALDIATKVSDNRARRDKQVGQFNSDQAEREMENLAGQKRLDLGDLARTAKLYSWPESKVKGLQNMQLGLISSPFEKQMIEEAMAPADQNAVYTMGDVLSAEKSLKQLAKDRNISTVSPDYREAIRRLQAMTDRLRIQGDIKDRTTEFQGRQTLEDYFGLYMPGDHSPEVTAEIKRHKLALNDLKPSERQAYVEKVGAELKARFEKNRSPTVNINRLRGALAPTKAGEIK